MALAVGTPNTAKIASPIYFSTVPPQAKICAVIRSWNSRSIATTVFGSHGLGHPREADDVDEQHGDGLPPHRSERFVLRGQHLDDVRREVARQIVARPLGRRAQALDLPQLGDVGERLADRDLEIAADRPAW